MTYNMMLYMLNIKISYNKIYQIISYTWLLKATSRSSLKLM